MASKNKRVTASVDKPVSFAMILASSAMLLIIGIAMVTSASSISSYRVYTTPFFDAKRQIMFAVLGIIGGAIFAYMSPKMLQKLTPVIFIGAVIFGALVFTPLVAEKGGNAAWVRIPGTSQFVQPSEFLKIAVVLYLALLLSHHRQRLTDRKVLATIAVVCGVSVFVVMGGHDLGTALILGAIIYVMLWQGGLPKTLMIALALAAIAYVGYEVVSNPTRLQRILAFLPGYELDPSLKELYEYQPRHGYWALGTGGLVGVGLGASREKWAYLPEAHNDYIFAIIGEELGLIGTLAVLGLYALLAWAIFRLRTQLTDRYLQLIATGLGVWIIGQALVNIYVVLGMMAVVGVPLPLISAGGSSLVATCCAIGILLSCARTEPGAQIATMQSPRVLRRSQTVITRRGKDKK